MKLLEFKLIKDNSLNEDECRLDMNKMRRFIQLEDDDETGYYGEFTESDDYVVPDFPHEGWKSAFWSGYMTAKLGTSFTDEDIFYYFYPSDTVPEVGGQWTLDDMVFERTK